MKLQDQDSPLPDIQWWGEKQFELHETKVWQLSSMILSLYRGAQEWRLQYHRAPVPNLHEQTWQSLPPETVLPQPIQVQRFMFKKTSDQFYLFPRLADRSVVIKPVHPILIPAGQRGTLYISTPLWVAGFEHSQKESLFDLPANMPKDTWFGPDRLTGEMCYATPVDGSTELNLLPPRAFRAVTPVHFHNTTYELLRLERMNIPVTALPLFHSPSTGRLWTSQIKVLHDNPERPPKIRIESRTPPQAGEVIALQPPRAPASALFNMFDSFF